MIESLQLPFVIGMVAVLMIMRVPVGISLLLAGATGFAFIRGVTITFDAIGGRLFDIGSGYALSAVPLFLLMGHVAAKAGRPRVTELLLELGADRTVRHRRNGSNGR